MGDNSYIVFDLSSVIPPANAQFRDIVFDMGKPSKITGFQIIGHELPNIKLDNFIINVVYKNPEVVVKEILKQMPGYTISN